MIDLSSPNVANLDGRPAVIAGDEAGRVMAYHLSDGSPVAGWPFGTGVTIDSTPSVAPIGPHGRDVVFLGSTSAAKSVHGGYWAINPNGAKRWFMAARNPASDPYPYNGVAASMTFATAASDADATSAPAGECGSQRPASMITVEVSFASVGHSDEVRSPNRRGASPRLPRRDCDGSPR